MGKTHSRIFYKFWIYIRYSLTISLYTEKRIYDTGFCMYMHYIFFRIIRHNHFLCYIPYASRFPFEMIVLPLAHHHDFSEMEDGLALALAQILSESIRRLAALFGDLPFNLTIHTAPNTGQSPRRSGYWSTLGYDWHWQVEILPRLHPVHGFEWGTGLFINPTPAEEAARYLREAKI